MGVWALHVSEMTRAHHASADALVPPDAPKYPQELITHGDVRVDNYYWLRDDERTSPAVLSHLTAENDYAAAAMADTQSLQEELYEEMKARIQEAEVSAATRDMGYYYYTSTAEGQQYKLHCRRPVPASAGTASEADVMDTSLAEEVLLDENQRKAAGNFSFYMVGSVATSPDNKLLAWTEDTTGNEKYTLLVKDLGSDKEVTQPIPMTSGDLVWASDNRHLLYTVKDELDRPYKVLLHAVGANKTDTVVFEERDEAYYVSVGRSRSGELIYIGSSSAVTNETYWLPAYNPEAALTLLAPRQQDVEYFVYHHPGNVLGAAARAAKAMEEQQQPQGWVVVKYRDPTRPNCELLAAPLDNLAQQLVLLPHQHDVMIEDVSLGSKWLVLSLRAKAQQSLVAYKLPEDGSMPTQLSNRQVISFDEAAFELSGGLTGGFDSEVLRLDYSSLTTPRSVYDQHLPSGRRALKKSQAVLGGFSREQYLTQRLWATALDGVAVPISLVFKRGAVYLDGSDPMLLRGYGAYGYVYESDFSRDDLSLIDRGWVVAVAHVRGGGEMGRRWYEDGKYMHKKNTFTDFIACAEHLIKLRYTSSSRLAIEGRSAGGLLMGAATNMRPDLFNAVIMGVPFVDVLTTMLDASIPLTTNEWEEWGDPRQPEYYNYMKSYSPVDNVAAQKYPAILVTAGLNDPRVGYWEPAKLVAKLRDMKTDANLLLLKCGMGAGHFSVTGRFARLRETAFEYAFLLKTAGMR
ncbi:prolyl oligopeptidase [Scenedesmus sp. NREL 46B-D3]|nr:prolyl oligopeptidase [Scenedesmus sp. NREL 46B-D3]